jgi:LuxR family maltose regulon positive regulatory protein
MVAAGALGAVREVLDGTAPVIGYVTLVEAHLLAGLAHRELGDQRAANQAAERALGLAEQDRLVLPFAMTGSRELLETLPRHETAHAALLADLLDVLHGSSSPVKDRSSSPPAEELSPGELRVLRFLPTNLSRPEIAGELSVSVNTVNTHVRSIYATCPPSTMASWTRHLPCTRSGSGATSGRRCCRRSRRWCRGSMARTPCSLGCWIGRRCTASWPRSRRSA